MTNVVNDIDIASVAALLSDTTRVAMLLALSDGRALPAGELARHARVSASTASEHLSRMADQRWLSIEKNGRHRYYRLIEPKVARAIEALAVVAPATAVRSFTQSESVAAVRAARTCYDHIAGQLGVAVTEALMKSGALDDAGDGYSVTCGGSEILGRLDLDLEAVHGRKRRFAPRCLDWSERRFHMAGALGAALTRRYFDLGWLARRPASRAVRLTDAGREGFHAWLGIEVGDTTWTLGR